MAFYFVTGKLGNGKTLSCVGRIRDKLRAGCLVATNIDLDLVAMFGTHTDKPRVIRVPDKPTVEDLEQIGNANPTYDENKNGLLVLDECGTWFNSRNWQDKSRQAVNNWFLHARKLGWDVLLIVQDISIVDSQAREALSEHTVFCRRIDNLAIPFLGSLYKAVTGSRLRLPRVHMAKVVYGSTPQDMLSDRWVYRGNDLFACYDTKQAFLADYPHGVYCLLTPWHLVGRYQVPRDREFYMRMTRILWKRFKSPVAMAAGVLLGVAFTAAAAFATTYRELRAEKQQLAHVQPVVSPTPQVPTATDRFFERLRQLRIIGSANINGDFSYTFADFSGKTMVKLNSEQLFKSGVVIAATNDCQAELRYRQHRTTVYCL